MEGSLHWNQDRGPCQDWNQDREPCQDWNWDKEQSQDWNWDKEKSQDWKQDKELREDWKQDKGLTLMAWTHPLTLLLVEHGCLLFPQRRWVGGDAMLLHEGQELVGNLGQRLFSLAQNGSS